MNLLNSLSSICAKVYLENKVHKPANPLAEGIRKIAVKDLIEKHKECVFEKGKLVKPRYGIVLSILHPKTKAIVAAGRVDYPVSIVNRKLMGFTVVSKKEIISDTNREIRYITIVDRLWNSFATGALVHVDENEYISTNPNSSSIDNLGTLTLGEIFEDEISE